MHNVLFKFDKGVELRNVVDGFQGIVTGRLEYLNGCRQYLLRASSLDKDGAPREGQWYDEQQLAFVGQGVRDLVMDPTVVEEEPGEVEYEFPLVQIPGERPIPGGENDPAPTSYHG